MLKLNHMLPRTRGIWPDLIIACALLAPACSNPAVEKQRHFERGNQYVAEHKDQFAAVEYANAVRLDPKFGQAHYKLAETYERLDNLRDAFPEYIRAADALPDDRQVQLKAIQVLLLVGRFDDAKARATSLLASNPGDADALLLRANAMAGLKDPAGAVAEIEQAMKIRPEDSRAYVGLGTIRMRSGEAKQAEAAFRRAIDLEPSSVDAHLAFANYLWSAARTDEAEQEIAQALSLDSRHLLANRMLAALYIATGRAAQAEKPLKTIADLSKAPDAKLELADYYLAVNRTQDAQALLTDLAQHAVPEAELKLAALDYAGNHRDEAHKRVDRLLAHDPAYAPALALKAQWLAGEHKLDEALDRANAAVAADPQSVSAHFVLATVHERRRELTDAIKSYNDVLQLNPRASAAQVALSRLNLATGNRDAAVRLAQEAAQTAPTSVEARVALARSLLAQGDVAGAESEVSKLAVSAPNSPTVQMLQGGVQVRRGHYDAARTSFERARDLSPQSVEALAGLVALDIRDQQTAAAVGRVESAVTRQPDNPELLALAAQVYEIAGKGAETEQALRHAVAVDPRFSRGYEMLAGYYLRQRRLDEARAEFEGMVKRDPTAPGPRTMVGVILETQGKRDEARRWYEDTVAAIDNAPVVQNNLAVIYADQGTNLDAALQLAQSAKQALPDNADVDDTLGWVYYRKNLPALAVGPLQESLKKQPDRPEVLYHLGLSYAELGDAAKAKQALARALALNPTFAGHDGAREALASIKQ